MQRLFLSFATLILTLLFSGCFDTATSSKPAIKRTMSTVYGSLEKGETSITIAKDSDNNGYVDENEFSHPLVTLTFQEHYTLSDIPTNALYAIRFKQQGYASITYNLVAGSQQINIDTFMPQYRSRLDVPSSDNLIFTLYQSAQGYSTTPKTPQDTPYFQLEIPRAALAKEYESITAVFDVQRDPRSQEIQHDNNSAYSLDVLQHINYTLLDENNQSVMLNTAPIETFANSENVTLYAYEGGWKHSATTAPQSRRALIAARKITMSQRSSVCVNATITQGTSTKALDEMQIDAYGPAHLRSVLGNNESFELYGNALDYNLSAQTRYVPGVQQTFELQASQQSGCDYEATLTFTNPYTKALHVHADTNGSYSLQDGYVWLHNADYSFYSYAYLDTLGDATFYVAPNSAYTLHYKNSTVTVAANQNKALINYIDTPPTLYHYFTKEDGNLFEILNVIALDDDVLLDINVTQSGVALTHHALEQNNAYHLWQFPIDATLIGNDTFDINISDSHNSVSLQTNLVVLNYPPEILSVTFTDKYGDVFDLNDTLYNTDYNLTIVTAPDKNGHTVKAWGSFNSNSSYGGPDNFSFSSGTHPFYVKANDGYSTTTQTYNLTIEPYPPLAGESNIITETLSIEDNRTYYFEAMHPYEEALKYQWYMDGILISEDENLTYIFNTPGYHELLCTISNHYKMINKQAIIDVKYIPIEIIEHNIFVEEVQLGTNRTYYFDAVNPYNGALQYKWYVNGVLASENEAFTYTFEQLGDFEISCQVSNQYETTTQSATIHATYEAPQIIDLSELPSQLLYGNYTFYVVAEDMQDDNLTYEWLINGNVVSTDTNFSKRFDQDEDVVITCNISNDYLTTTVSRATRIYYPKPVITKGLKNTQTSEATTFNVEAYHDLDYDLTYQWLLDGTIVSTSKTYNYIPQDAQEHNLTCKVSNLYKSAYTSATIGTTLTSKNLVIDTLPGNHVVIYDDDMNITHDYIADDNGTVSHATTQSHINFAVIANNNTELSQDMFFKLVARDHPCLYYTSILHVNFNKAAPHLRTIPNFDIEHTYDLNNDSYFDKAEIFQFGLETFDINHNNKIELGEIYFSSNSGDMNLSALDAKINMHYPVGTYQFRENRFMDLINAYVYRANLGLFPQYQNEQLSCGVNQSYIDITITGMPYELYPRKNFVQMDPSFLPRNSLELPSNEIISVTSNSVSSEPATEYNITYRAYSFTKNDKDLTDVGLLLFNDSMYYIPDVNTTVTQAITVSYNDLIPLTEISEPAYIPYSDYYSVLFHNGQSTLSGYEYLTDADYSFYTAEKPGTYLLTVDTSYSYDSYFNYIYTLDYAFSLAEQTSFSTLANSVFATKEENYPPKESLSPFFKRRYEELYTVEGDDIEEVDLVRYQYQLTDGHTAYASIQVNYPNNYIENKRFIGFIRMDNNESFSSLLPQALQEEAERFFAITNTTVSRPYFNEKVQLIDLKNFAPNDRDDIIRLLEENEIEALQRKESTFYNYDDYYDYYGE